MSAGLRIRAATHADFTAVENLLLEAKLPVEGIRDFFPQNYAVAERDGNVVGAIGVETYGRYGLVRSAVVSEAARGSGIGGDLVRERLAWSRSNNIQQLFLLTTTAPAFFEKLGFQFVDRAEVPREVHQAQEFASICPASATVMMLRL
jgi:amino-acid N-acetyltransferase